MGRERTRRPRHWVAVGVVGAVSGVVGAVGWPHGVAAASSVDPAITQFRVGGVGIINDLVTGPDSALWFTWATGPDGVGIGRMSTSGSGSSISIPNIPGSHSAVGQITAGDGALWVPESRGGADYISEWSTSMTLIKEFPVPGAGEAGIAWGPDGALWFATVTSSSVAGMPGGAIGRMTTTGNVTTYPLPAGTGGVNEPDQVIAGSDGAIWFDMPGQASVGRITVSGSISVFPLTGVSGMNGATVADQSLAAGRAGATWIGAWWTHGVQRLTPGTSSVPYQVPGVPISLTAGSDGNLWFATQPLAGPPPYAGELSTAGTVIAEYPLPPSLADSGRTITANAITAGPDGKIWLADELGSGEIDRLDPSIPAPPVAVGVGGITVPGTGAIGSRTEVYGVIAIVIGSVLAGAAGPRRRRNWRSEPLDASRRPAQDMVAPRR